MERVVRGELTRAAAALVRGVSERQSVRLTARIRTEGGRGGIHGHRGRGSPPRARAAPPRPRARRAAEGLLRQVEGRPQDWREGRGVSIISPIR